MIICECRSMYHGHTGPAEVTRRWRTPRVQARTRGMSLSTAAVWAFLLATSSCVSAEQRRDAPLEDGGVYMPGQEQQVDLAEVLEQGELEFDESENEASRLQKLASLLSVLRSTLNERQQEQGQGQGQGQGQAVEEQDSQQLGGAGYLGLLPLIKDEDKRGSYMSLCHFKICNMGRKRNLRWHPFMRM